MKRTYEVPAGMFKDEERREAEIVPDHLNIPRRFRSLEYHPKGGSVMRNLRRQRLFPTISIFPEDSIVGIPSEGWFGAVPFQDARPL